MLKTDELVQTTTGSTLTQWATTVLDIPKGRVHVRLRGNNLHILCESVTCPAMAIAVDKLVDALKQRDLNALLPREHPHIYEVFLYGRTQGSKRPEWSVRIDPHHPDSPATVGDANPGSDKGEEETLNPGQKAGSPKPMGSSQPHVGTTAKTKVYSMADAKVMLCAQSRACLGDPEAEALLAKGIARYLSESLSVYSVSVKAIVKELKESDRSESKSAKKSHPRRLWVFCQSAYSPDPSLLAEPVSERLRELHLENFREAVLVGQVSGESKPEWLLRVDLTPPEQMLQKWAKWGDIEALTRLLNETLAPQGLQVRGVQKESTLHLFCSNLSSRKHQKQLAAANKDAAIGAIAPILKALTPQGIHAVTLYGCREVLDLEATSESPPLWVDWMDLPASRDPALAPGPLELASQGNSDALQFLLDRLLNPDLDNKLATGGIHVSLRQRDELLHVMLDAPLCPEKTEVAPQVIKFVRQLDIAEILGVRVYGRRAGQKQPSWRYGFDFSKQPPNPRVEAQEMVEAAPEFAVSDAYANDLLPEPGGLVLSPDLTQEDLQACLTKQITTVRQPRERSSSGLLTRLFISTGLFIPSKSFRRIPARGTQVAWVWGTLGLLLMLHGDWWLAQQEWSEVGDRPGAVSTESSSTEPLPILPQQAQQPPLPELSLNKAGQDEQKVFDPSGFTRGEDEGLTTPGNSTIANFDYPSFNSEQLDEQVRLYLEYLERVGPPDVLIVGSSRALRGVAPMTLEQALADRYPGLKVFNFGINGATSQVVDFVIRQLLPPEQLPKLILWADGARAFNSGRSDRTFEAIAASEGYSKLSQGIRPILPELEAEATKQDNTLASLTDTLAQTARGGLSVADSYKELNNWLNERLASVSKTYERRDRIKAFLTSELLGPVADSMTSIAANFTDEEQIATEETEGEPSVSPAQDSLASLSEELATDSTLLNEPTTNRLNGFLPLSVRFNPSTYYEKHARVSGNYDADYESFQLAGTQTAALKNLLQFTRERQIPLVFVNMPLTQDYLDPVRLDYEREFQQYMLTLSMENEGFSFRDLSQLWPTQNDRFSDPSHLNRYGAHEVSNRLSQDPMIPWPQTQTQ